MNAPYYIFPPVNEDDIWGVYGRFGLVAAHRSRSRAERLCNELNFGSGAAGGALSDEAERVIVAAWKERGDFR